MTIYLKEKKMPIKKRKIKKPKSKETPRMRRLRRSDSSNTKKDLGCGKC